MRIDPGNRLTFDLSFVLRGVKPGDKGHSAASELLVSLSDDIRSRRRVLIEPAHFVIELNEVAWRRSSELDWHLVRRTLELQMDLVGFDASACQNLLQVLNEHFPEGRRPRVKRGADLVYLAAARSASAVLISSDDELLKFNGPHFQVRSPEDCL
jgi:hypothetical protein